MKKKFLSATMAVLLSAAIGIAGPTAKAAPENSQPSADVLESCNPTGIHERRDIDLVLLIDQSKSLRGDRLRNLGQALNSLAPVFAENDNSVRVALATFSQEAQLLRSLDEGPLQEQQFESFIESVTVEDKLQGGTNYLAATEIVLDEVRQHSDPLRCKVLIWFTDGEVDIPGEQNRIVESQSVLSSFCGGDAGSSSKAESFRSLGIQPYVVLLTSEPFQSTRPDMPSKDQSTDKADPYRKWASVIALRGITGDWDEAGVAIQPPGTQCDRFADSWGKLFQVNGVDELVKALIFTLISTTTDSPPELCPKSGESLRGLPAGVFFQKVIVAVGWSKQPGDLLVEPGELQPYVSGALLILNRKNPEEAAVLDALPPGWNLILNGTQSIDSLCFGYTFRTASDLKFTAAPSLPSVRVPRQPGDEGLTAEIDLREFADAIDVENLHWSDDSVSFSGTTASISPGAVKEQIDVVPGTLVIRPTALGEDGESLVAESPILGTLLLSPPVRVTGIDELPQVACSQEDDEGNLLLEVKAVREEVSTSRYRSRGTCSIARGTNSAVGKVRLTIQNPAITTSEFGGFGMVIDGRDSAPSAELLIDASDLNTQNEIQFYIEQSKPFENRQIDLSLATEVDVTYVQGDGEFKIGTIKLVENLSLLGRSNKKLALVIALIASLLSAVLAYVVLFVVVRKTARVGRSSELASLTADVTVLRRIGGPGSGVEWLDKDKFAPPAFDVTKVRELETPGRKILAGRIELEAQTGKFNHPLDVVRGPWTKVASSEASSLGLGISVNGRKPGSALAPVGPLVIADVLSVDATSSSFGVRLTFIVPTRGKSANYEGVMKLANSSAMSAITKALNSVDSRRGRGEQVSTGETAEATKDGQIRPAGSPTPLPRPSEQDVGTRPSSDNRPEQSRPNQNAGPNPTERTNRPPGSSPR